MKKPSPLIFLILLFSSKVVFADARISRFRNSFNSQQYIALGGVYYSDYNSKEYKISASHQYKNNRFISEIDFLHNVNYVENTRTGHLMKNEELYDGELSAKILIGKSNNYFNYYNRSKYDQFSDYYYDFTNSFGWGRILLNGLLEADINIGYNEIKNFDSQIVLNPNLKASFDLTDRIRLIAKAYIFKVKNDYSEELKTRISYKIAENMALELYHSYEKKRFFHSTISVQENLTRTTRNLAIRIRYDF